VGDVGLVMLVPDGYGRKKRSLLSKSWVVAATSNVRR